MTIANSNDASTPTANRSAVCTLFEGHYHLGVAALVNSLTLAGFNGRFVAGYRGDLPQWAAIDENGEMKLAGGPIICFVRIEGRRHLANYKPEMILRLEREFAPGAEAYFYFDPDIVVKGSWGEFEHWVKCGVALVEDIENGNIYENHPLRAHWRDFLANCGMPVRFETRHYCNSGFVGVPPKQMALIALWNRVVQEAHKQHALDESRIMFSHSGRAFPFVSFDQDCLNCAIMAHPGTLSVVGPEGMDFEYCGYHMSHATNPPKPWHRNYIVDALRGRPPTMADKAFWSHANGIIRPHSEMVLALRRIQVGIGAAVGRFVRRK